MRVSEALALETRHFTNQDQPLLSAASREKCLRARLSSQNDAAERQIDLHPDIAEYLRKYTPGRRGCCFKQQKGTPISTAIGGPLAHTPAHQDGIG